MILLWNRKEIYNGNSIGEFNRLRDILSIKGIKYDFKTVNRSTASGFDVTRTRTGSMGENLKYSYEYYIYVHKAKYDEARLAINNYKN